MKENLLKRIKKFEDQGWEYVQNFNTGKHILSEALIKRNGQFEKDEIKVIKDGHITKYC